MLKKTKTFLTSAFLFLVSHSSSAAIQVPDGSRIAFAFKEPGSESVASYHGDTFMTPASTEKVLTALAAMLYFGPDWQFKTKLLVQQGSLQDGHVRGDVIVKFDGAPDLTRQSLVNLLAFLKQQKITQIDGNILLDISGYAGYDHGDGSSWSDLPVCFTAPASAVVVDRNCVYAQLNATQLGRFAEPIIPAGQPITITSEALVVSQQEYYSGCELRVDMNTANNYHLSGCIPQQSTPWPLSLSISDPTAWGVDLITWAAAKAGLSVAGQVKAVRHVPDNLTELAHVPSAPLNKLMDRMLKRSDNLYADSLARALGHYYLSRVGNYASGADAVRLILKNKAGIDLGSAMIVDGSGLSAHDLITPKQMLAVLEYIALHDKELGIIDLLPVAGVSGTLGSRGSVQNKPLVRNVTAKTGTLQNVSNLAGFMTTASGKRKAFVLMANGLTFPPNIRSLLKAHKIASPHYKFERAILEQIYYERPIEITE